VVDILFKNTTCTTCIRGILSRKLEINFLLLFEFILYSEVNLICTTNELSIEPFDFSWDC